MADYQSSYKGSVIDQTVSTVLNGQAGIQGVSVNGTELTPDSNNKVSFNVPNVLQTTGTSTTDVMSQNSVTDALSNKANSSDLATVATSGSYSDLSNTPNVPSVVQTTGSSTTDTMSQDAITTALSGKASVSTYNITLLASGWSGNVAPPYTQTVSVSGILSTDNVFAYVILSSSTSTALNESGQWGFVSQMTTSNGSITAKCLEFKPNIDLNISLIVIR